MSAYQIHRPSAHVLFGDTVLKPGWYVKFFLTGTSTPVDVWTTPAFNVAHDWPVEADAAGVLPVIYLDPSVVYKTEVYDQNDVLQPEYGADPANDQPLSQAGVGAALYPRSQAEIDAGVVPTNRAYPPLNLRRYGGAPSSGDNTTAMNQALAVTAQLGGGRIVLDTSAKWLMNVVIAQPNVVISMPGGQAEFDTNEIAPYNIASAAITFGDGVSRYYYCGLENVHISGTDGTSGSDRESAKSAPHGLLIKGGIINFTALNCWFYNGIRTVSIEPSAVQPTTQISFIGGGARNDLWDSADARTIYGKRLADPGYFTDVVFTRFKINGPGVNSPAPTLGYAIELDGTGSPGMVGEFIDCYGDIAFDFTSKGTVCHGALLKTAQIKSRGLQLDPGTTGACVIETTDAIGSDISRYIVGELRHGGQKFKYSDAVVDLPAEGETFSYRQRISTPFLHGLTKFTTIADPYDVADTAPYLDTDSATGPVTLNRSDWSIKTAGKGLRVAEGSNAKQGVSTLVGGTVTVSNTSVTANSRIFLTSNADGGTPGFLRVSARVNGTSFTITSSNGADTSTVAWLILEPA